MSQYEDEDGVDGPFNAAMDSAMREDKRARLKTREDKRAQAKLDRLDGFLEMKAMGTHAPVEITSSPAALEQLCKVLGLSFEAHEDQDHTFRVTMPEPSPGNEHMPPVEVAWIQMDPEDFSYASMTLEIKHGLCLHLIKLLIQQKRSNHEHQRTADSGHPGRRGRGQG